MLQWITDRNHALFTIVKKFTGNFALFQQCIHSNAAPRSKHTTKTHHAMRQSVHIHLNPLYLLQAFVVTRHANYFIKGKCTVAAVQNLSVQVLPLYRKGMGKFISWVFIAGLK